MRLPLTCVTGDRYKPCVGTWTVVDGVAARAEPFTATKGRIMIETVLGPIRPEQMQACLTHEHLTLYGTNEASITIREQALEIIVPRLRELREKYHCNAMVECTLSGSTGRDLVTYAEIARQAKFHVIASTGFYTVARSPWWMKDASVPQLVRRWQAEVRRGMDGTGIRPGVLKATAETELSDQRHRHHGLVTRWFEALARTQQATGLPITTHLGDDQPVAQLQALTKYGVAPAAITIGHADGHGPKAVDQLLMVADQGANLSFNCAGLATKQGVRRDMALVKLLVDRGYLGQITLSVDAGFWPEVSLRLGVGDPKRTYRCVFTQLVPVLKKLGITPGQIKQMLVANPRRHLGLK